MFIKDTLKTIAFSLITLSLISVAYAWTEPTATPPSGNTSVPLNTSGTAQIKSGMLWLNSGGASTGLIVEKGNVGIGTTSPGDKLDVGADVGQGIRVGNPNLRQWTIGLGTGGPLNIMDATAGNYTVASFAGNWAGGNIIFTPTGNVGIGTASPGQKLDVAGNVQASAFLYSSDRSLKTDISKIENALDKILALDGVNFKWKDSGKKSVGLIAQDVEKVFPELVTTDKNTGLKSVEYGNLTGALIEAVKQQQTEIDLLKLEIEKLKK